MQPLQIYKYNTHLRNIQISTPHSLQYKVCFKDKVEQSRERSSSALPYTSM